MEAEIWRKGLPVILAYLWGGVKAMAGVAGLIAVLPPALELVRKD